MNKIKAVGIISSMKLRRITFLLSFSLLTLFLIMTWQQSVAAQNEVVRVVTKEIEPFVIKEGEHLTGFSIDLWKEIVLLTDLPFEFIEVGSVEELLEAVALGQADVAIAAISMTPEREELVDFSYPYFQAGLQIVTVPKAESGLREFFDLLFSPHVLFVFSVLILLLVVIGHVVWLTERSKNNHFPKSYLPGVWEGIWWASVTVTTVGYGDRTIKGVTGRVMAIFWMFAGIVLIANFTAVITTELTVSKLETSINGVEDLPGKRVATIKDTTSADFLRQRRIVFQATDTIEDAFELLAQGEIDAIVYDAPVLQYYVATNTEVDFLLVGSPFHYEDYGIALPHNSPYEEIINQALLELRENGTYGELANRWSLHVGSR